MGGFFGVATKRNCTLELFYGVDYHSHLGTRRAGMATHGKAGFQRAIHNIENTPFRTKFEKDVDELTGNLGIGCISDYDPQPLIIQSHFGSFALTVVGKINNSKELLEQLYQTGYTHFQEMSGGRINGTELVASLICRADSLLEGIKSVQESVDGSVTMLIMTAEGIFAVRDKHGRLPLMIGRNEAGFCVSSESFAYINLDYQDYKELGPAEVVFITPEGMESLSPPCKEEMKMCSFLWVYYGYPTSVYEGVGVEEMRYRCGHLMAKRDKGQISPDIIAGVPDSGVAHAIGYANASGVSYARPFIKYTPTWPRSFLPTHQRQRDLIARMKLIPVYSLIRDKKMLLIDDSIVRGTQLKETTEFLYQSGAKEVHVRSACPPLLYGCKYLNFSRPNSDMELITRRVIQGFEPDISGEAIRAYAIPGNPYYEKMVEEIRRQQNYTSLKFHLLDDLIESIGLPSKQLCTYCFNGDQ
ncbi:MAG: amidophosphoribosyltransferase [Lachnospiraceae bacterium]|nr:amidophosphoribosyltransferase [Lachnospiraceae bacterium]